MEEIYFFSEALAFTLPQEEKVKAWLIDIARANDQRLSLLNYIFCSDDYLLQINQEYLQHDDYTDIITFDQTEPSGPIEGDIFISVERVRENALTWQSPFETELRRVIAHGLLHLLGFGDKTETEAAQMRQKEEQCLMHWNKLPD